MTQPRPARVLMVCTGNICRSTMAHAVLEQAAARAGVDVVVDSAGVSDEEQGNPIDRRAARVLRDAGYAVPDHRARQIRASELGEWDLILAMTSRHLNVLQRLADRAGVEYGGRAERRRGTCGWSGLVVWPSSGERRGRATAHLPVP